MASAPAKDDDRSLEIGRMARMSIRPPEDDGNVCLNNEGGATPPRCLSVEGINHPVANFSFKRPSEAKERVDHRQPEEMALHIVHGSGSLASASSAFPESAEIAEAFSNMAMFLNITR